MCIHSNPAVNAKVHRLFESLSALYTELQLHLVCFALLCKSPGWALLNHHAKFISKRPVFQPLVINNKIFTVLHAHTFSVQPGMLATYIIWG